jgi:predicted glycogen debranching enzyme
MEALIRRYPVPRDNPEELRAFLHREWLLTNGLGGYASGTLGGDVSRRYHGLLIAALPAPLGRTVMFNHLAETLRLPDGRRIPLGVEQDSTQLVELRLEYQLPVWRYDCEGIVVEKRILLVNGQNTLHVTYELVDGAEQAALELRPSFQFRGHEADVGQPVHDYTVHILDQAFEISNGPEFPPLRLMLRAGKSEFRYDGGSIREVSYQHEAERGYRSRGQLWSPGYFLVPLGRQRGVTLVASTETWATMRALQPAVAHAFAIERRRHLLALAGGDALDSTLADLTLSADQFIITPAGRVEDSARARAAGDEVRTVIAGYHWFTDWGRDTMISLEGLTLATGRHHEAGWILRTFAHHVRDGLIPNLFPEGENEGLYHTADATLWFFHALDRYVALTGDRETLARILPKLREIVAAHERGTRFGIGVDPADGLLRQGAEGYQLTWMDAKVDGWVVTPRRGKAVEINALWYQTLRLMEEWLREAGDLAAGAEMGEKAARMRESFNARFWNPRTGHLFDIVDGEHGDDAACRPNQIFAVSLRHAVLDPDKWAAVAGVVRDRLLTPYGLRSLSADHPDYKPRYFGDLRARDAAYHQGTVWAWLIGPFIDAWLKVHPGDKAGARQLLEPLAEHLNEAGLCSISEIFDAEAPFHPRGCIAQAWSVAEVLRCWKKTMPNTAPAQTSHDDV